MNRKEQDDLNAAFSEAEEERKRQDRVRFMRDKVFDQRIGSGQIPWLG